MSTWVSIRDATIETSKGIISIYFREDYVSREKIWNYRSNYKSWADCYHFLMTNYLFNLFYQLRKFWQSIVVCRIRSSYPLPTARVIVKTDSRDRYLRIICVFTTPGKFIARATTCFVNEIKISIHAPLEDKIDVNRKVVGLSVPHTVQINNSKIFIKKNHQRGVLFPTFIRFKNKLLQFCTHFSVNSRDDSLRITACQTITSRATYSIVLPGQLFFCRY